jgi:DNA-binding transcriptional ArsR family regulator
LTASPSPRPHRSGDDAIFAALADPNRRAILQAVADHGPVTATALAAEFPMSRQGVAKHLDVLRTAGLVRATRRGRETRFEADLVPLDDISRWMNHVGVAWERRLDRLSRVATPER